MRIEEEFEVAVPIAHLYVAINDVGVIGYCVAGVKDVKVLGDDLSEWKVEVRAGFMARIFKLQGKIVERHAPTYLRFAARGQDLEMNGHVALAAVNDTSTSCGVVVEVVVTGPFATVVDLMAKTQQQQLIKATIENIRRMLEGRSGAIPKGAKPRSSIRHGTTDLAPTDERTSA